MTYNVYFVHPDGERDSFQVYSRADLDRDLTPDPRFPIRITDILNGSYEAFSPSFYKAIERRLGYRLEDATY